MPNPLQSIACRWLSTTANQDPSSMAKMSRRGFLALAGALTSCSSSKDPLAGLGPTQYHRDPRTNRLIPNNPDLRISAEFPLQGQDITYTRALVSGKFIAMTFDDGPHPHNTPRLLNILSERNIKATFFVIGQSVEAHPQVLRQTVEEGHEIGNHTQTHRLLTRLDDESLHWEFGKCRDAVEKASGYDMKLMRPPYGGLNQRQRQLAYLHFNYPTILWSVDPLDWKRPGPSVVASRIIRDTRPGAIVLAHDLHASTVTAMPQTLDELLYQGYKFVTVSQLLALQSQMARPPETLLSEANS